MKNKKMVQKSVEIGGRKIILETGDLAPQANGSVLIRYGDTCLLATVTTAIPKEDWGYFPLTVEYVERLYAGGIIKGSRWVKREGRPSDEAILIGRLVDRSIRPLFPKGYSNEVQVMITVLSIDHENDPALLAIVGASAAIHISDVPWDGPVGAVRIGQKDGVFFVNPLESDRDLSDLDLVTAGSKDGVDMIEAGANQVSEEKFLEGISFAETEIKKIIDFIEDFRKEAGKQKQKYVDAYPNKEFISQVERLVGDRIKKLAGESFFKEDASSLIDSIAEEAKLGLTGEFGFIDIKKAIEEILKEKVRDDILNGKRPDGRKTDEIRPLDLKVSVLPRTHGSAIFQRGETQVLTVTTLGALSLRQLIESPEGEAIKRYIHHYSMPPYATGQTGRIGSPSRRETGHGALAERALMPVIPSEEKFPYTIRIVSEVLSSNGSTSMASTCGSTLSLMDAGVPITDPVAGISMGLVAKDKDYVLLTDIIGLEDFDGDMDFKVAGTEKGITAVQLDIKLHGLSKEIVEETIKRAREARLFILKKIAEVLSEPREKISQYAPKVSVVKIDLDKIGTVIGPGGRTIKKIIEETGAQVDIEDDGVVSISGISQEAVDAATEKVKGLVREVEVGEIYKGVVKRVQPFGVFVEILPGKEGLIHVSKLADGFIDDPGKVVSVDQEIEVKVWEIDEMHRINLEPVQKFKAPPGQGQPRQSFARRPFGGESKPFYRKRFSRDRR